MVDQYHIIYTTYCLQVRYGLNLEYYYYNVLVCAQFSKITCTSRRTDNLIWNNNPNRNVDMINTNNYY